MNSVVDLIKAAQQSGEPLFKGDVAGHEFHGNQHTGGGGGAKAKENSEERALRVGSEKLLPKLSADERFELLEVARLSPTESPWNVIARLEGAVRRTERSHKEPTLKNVKHELTGV